MKRLVFLDPDQFKHPLFGGQPTELDGFLVTTYLLRTPVNMLVLGNISLLVIEA